MSLRPHVAILVKTWPRISETFIVRELTALEARGFDIQIWSLQRPLDTTKHPIHSQVRGTVRYLPEHLRDEPLRVIRSLFRTFRNRGVLTALYQWWLDLMRDPTRTRLRRIGQSCVLASELGLGVGVIYAHFLHGPSVVARYTAILRALPWGFSAHAKDIWLSPDWDKREKIKAAAFALTCTWDGASHLRALANEPQKIKLAYHGLDVSRIPQAAARINHRDGNDTLNPVRFLSVGRLVEKKGFDILISALSRLPPRLAWRWDHIGSGPLSENLAGKAASLNLDHRIWWHGLQTEPFVLDAMQAADLFVLPCRIASNGDRDGLPNVLLEAASQKLAIITTPVGGIPEFIEHDVNGILVHADVKDIADALASLACDPMRRASLGNAAYQKLVDNFSAQQGIAVVDAVLRQALHVSKKRS